MARENPSAETRFRSLHIIKPGLHTFHNVGEDEVLVRDKVSNNDPTLTETEEMNLDVLDDWAIKENNEDFCIVKYVGIDDTTSKDSDSDVCGICNQEYVAYHKLDEEDNPMTIEVRDDFDLCVKSVGITKECWIHQ